MKRLITLTSLLLFIVVSISCSSDDDSKTSGQVSFIVDGSEMVYKDIRIIPSQTFEFDNEYYRTALVVSDDNYSAIRITFPIDERGTYGYYISYVEDNVDFLVTNNVEFEVTRHRGGKLEGTFSGTFANMDDPANTRTREIENGNFSIRY